MALPVFANITPDTLNDNPGGTSETWLFSPKSFFTTLEVPSSLSDTAVTTFDQWSVISADHAFATGKKPFEIYCTMDKGTGKFSPMGERDGRSSKAEFKLFVPGINGVTLGKMRRMKNERWIVFPILSDGQVIQLGTNLFACDVTFETDIVTNSSGLRGTTITVSHFESFGPYLYTGVFPA